MTATTRRQ